MTRTTVLLALLGGAALVLPSALFPSPARAHSIQSTLERISTTLNGSSGIEKLEIHSSFSSGVPAGDANVRLLPLAGGDPIELGRTGADGRLTFVLPPVARGGGEIQVDAGPGHRDFLELSDIEPTGPAKTPTTQAHRHTPRQPWPWQASTVLIGMGLVGGAGLFGLLRRDT
ncbi:hypothetical protein [Synechococcus sp. CCY 0621]|uniref:hypothetical protein n=1 Tax=Synechococcus sp. CCY 0621 TaxID=2815603 RepID=UPI001C22A7E2|nr:hypothetical protein [Synechococcus sp. CCY 0621]